MPLLLLQVGKSFELLNSDKHKSQIAKFGRDNARPDIAHQVGMALSATIPTLVNRV